MSTLAIIYFLGCKISVGIAIGISVNKKSENDKLDFWGYLNNYFLSWVGVGIYIGQFMTKSIQALENIRDKR